MGLAGGGDVVDLTEVSEALMPEEYEEHCPLSMESVILAVGSHSSCDLTRTVQADLQ